jgi:hypothetical protein
MLAPPRVLTGDLTVGWSPVEEEMGIFNMPTMSRVAPPSSSDHDLADHDHTDHVPSSSTEQL